MAEYINGWVKLHRQILNWEWFKKPETLALFIYCLTRANIMDGSWRNIAYERGQFITSLDSIRKDTGLTIQQARTALKHLISTGEITSTSTNQYRIITVCKFNDYQTMQNEVNIPNNTQLTSDQQANLLESNKQSTTGKEEEEDKEIRRVRKERKISSKEDKKKSLFVPPSLDEIRNYISEKSYCGVDASIFFEYYSENDWMCGNRKMKDWKKKINEWQKRANQSSNIPKNGIAPAEYNIILPTELENS